MARPKKDDKDLAKQHKYYIKDHANILLCRFAGQYHLTSSKLIERFAFSLENQQNRALFEKILSLPELSDDEKNENLDAQIDLRKKRTIGANAMNDKKSNSKENK